MKKNGLTRFLRYTGGQILIVHRCLYIADDSTSRTKILDGQNVAT
jgi:hypothetical protein